MPITVIDSDGDPVIFDDANSWHVDTDRHLHLRSSGNKQIATFAGGSWQSVGHSEADR